MTMTWAPHELHERLSADPRWLRLQVGEDGECWQRMGLRVIWSVATELDGRLWLHVSASRMDRLPSYGDMTMVKRIFVGAHRMAYSLWVPEAEHVNIHARALHLWHPMSGPLPLPDFTRGMGTI